MTKRFIRYLIYGILAGNTFLVINVILAELNESDLMDFVLENFTFSAIILMVGGIGMVTSSIVYTFDRLNKFQQVAIHFAVSLCAVMVVAFALDMFPMDSPTNIATIFLSFTFSFFAIWYAHYLYEKREAKKVNDMLRKREKQDE